MQLKLSVKILFALAFATLAVAAPVEVMARDDVTSPPKVPEDHHIEARDRGHNAGHNAGHDAGHDAGHGAGHGAAHGGDHKNHNVEGDNHHHRA